MTGWHGTNEVQQRGVEAPLYYSHTHGSLTLFFLPFTSHSYMTTNDSLHIRIATLEARITLLEKRLTLCGAAPSKLSVKVVEQASPQVVLASTTLDQ